MIAARRRYPPIAAALVALATFAVYLPQLPTGVAVGDQAEAQTVPYVLGLMHPTGFPLYTLAGWVWSHVIVFASVAWRLNALTAACTALTAAGVVLLATALESGTLAAACAGAAFAFGSTVWNGALAANAQPLSSACSLLALAAAVAFAGSGSPRALLASCGFCGLGLAAHPSALWMLPAILVALAWRRAALTPRLLTGAAAALVLPLLFYAYLPLRAAAIVPPGSIAMDPPPLAPGSLDWDPGTPQTLDGVLDRMLARHEHASSFLGAAFAPQTFPSALAAWWRSAVQQYRFGLPLLAVAGLAVLARSDRRALSVVGVAWLGCTFFAYAYRYDVHADRYATVSFAIAAAVAAATTRAVAVRAAVTVALVLMAALAVDADRPPIAPLQPGEWIVAAVARDTPDGAIVIAPWDEANALRYGAFVEGKLGSRTILTAWPAQYAYFYQTWVRSRRVFLYAGPTAMSDIGFLRRSAQARPSSLPGYRVTEVTRHER